MLTGLWRFVGLTCLVLAAAGCDSVDIVGVTPTGAATAPFVNRGGLVQRDFFAVHPAFLVPRFVAQPFCPSVPPFFTDFTLFVHGDPFVETTLGEIRMTFVDRSGLRAPELTLPNTILTRRFGSLLIPAGGTRQFPLDAGFGCTTGRFGTLHLLVTTLRRGGHHSSGLVTVPVG
jgi:hypothetical protein